MFRRSDVYELRSELVVEVEVPGVEPERLLVTLHEDRLHLALEPGPADDETARRWHRRERAAGRDVREIPLPRLVDPDAARVSLAHGLLVLRLPLRDVAASGRRLALVEDVARAA